MREVEFLREAMNLYGVSFDRAGMFIGVPGNTVRRWIRGQFEPNHIYQNAIVEGVKKMAAEFEPRLKMEKRPDGSEVSKAWWGSLSGDTMGPAAEPDAANIEAENRAMAELNKIVGLILPVATEIEREVLRASYVGFSEWVKALYRHGFEIAVK